MCIFKFSSYIYILLHGYYWYLDTYIYIIYIYYHILNMITVLRGRTTQLLTKFVITWLVRNQIWQPVEKFPNYAPGGRTSLRFLHKKSPSEHHIPICSMYAISTNIYVIQKMTRNLLVNIQETWSTSDFLDFFSYNCSEAQEDRTVKFDQTIVANDFSIFLGGAMAHDGPIFSPCIDPQISSALDWDSRDGSSCRFGTGANSWDKSSRNTRSKWWFPKIRVP
jgi:hypothetical protein